MFNQKIVFTNGCFDILHQGHVDYLCKAKDLGHKLIIGLNTDASVKRQNKSPERPINTEQSRALILAALGFVDAIVLFDEETPYNLINAIQPNVLVKGADYKAEEIVGYDILKANGGEVITIELTEGFSTTALINKIKH
jgi:rfaE bifunctional protein nucleotidyltransferase chain/domain